jgi:hypothetical protein
MQRRLPYLYISIKLQHYVDDVLVPVYNLTDLRCLKEHTDLFYSTSNVRFNYNKTEVFSLSGRPILSF